MTELKLRRLPERDPVRLTIALMPELRVALDDYAAAYEAAYGKREQIADLVPAMLAAFLESDRAFVRSRQGAKL